MKENVSTTSGGTWITPVAPFYRRVSWGAVFAGLVIGLAIQLALSLLGIAIGASTLDPLQGDTPGKGMAIGAGLWLLVSGLISTYIGACVAAHLSGATRKSDGVLHGLLSWGAATLLMALLFTSAVGTLIGGGIGLLGQAAGGAAQAAGEAADDQASVSGRLNIDIDAMKREVREAVGATGQQSGQQQGAGEQAREAGDTAARVSSQAALWGFLMLALGAVAATLGGASARRTTIETTRVEPA
ncbi:MAG: hypothetical protein L0Y58_17990 [Verrucomicrobia subdivision 3 bacterium]|nr:hypothetical protein [Limisphaerales bacterium]